MSNYTFYEYFDGVDDALAATFGAVAEAIAKAGEPNRPDQVDCSANSSLWRPLIEAAPRAVLGLELAVAIPGLASERQKMLERLGEHMPLATTGAGAADRAKVKALLAASTVAVAIERPGPGSSVGALATELTDLLGLLHRSS